MKRIHGWAVRDAELILARLVTMKCYRVNLTIIRMSIARCKDVGGHRVKG